MTDDLLPSANAIVDRAIAQNSLISIVVIAICLPEWLYAHRGRVLLIGAYFPERPVASRNFQFLEAHTAVEVSQAAVDVGMGWTHPCDLLVINHDHRLSAILKHVEAAEAFCGPQTVMIFDGAYPPDLGMAGPEPTQDWWVGEAWMLQRLLRPRESGGFLAVTDLPPVGLLLARNVSRPDAGELARQYAELSQVVTVEELSSLCPPTSPGTLLSWLVDALDSRSRQQWMELVIANEPPATVGTRRVLDAAVENWTKSPPLFVSDLSNGGHDVSALLQSSSRIHCKVLDGFDNAWIIGCNSVITEGRYFDRNFGIGTQTLRRIADGLGTPANEATHIERHNELFRLPRARLASAQRVQGHTLFGSADEPDNWGMWLLLGLPSLHLFLHGGLNFDHFMTRAVHPWQRSVLAEIGLKATDLLPHVAEDPVAFEQLSIVRHSWRDLAVTPSDAQVFASLTERFPHPAKTPERIFISRLSRTRAGAYRGLLNELELLEQFEMLGFTVVEPELLSMPEQVSLFAGARVVVGLGGAGLFNAVFCRPGTLVVSIESSTHFAPSHTNLFASCRLVYGVILGEQNISKPGAEQRPWTIDATRAASTVQRYL